MTTPDRERQRRPAPKRDAAELPATLGHPAKPNAALGAVRAIGGYEVLGRIGAGGMGEVLRVRDPELDRVLAAKVIANPRNDPAVHAKFLREARITGRLQHPAIVPVHELGCTEDGRPFFTMKEITGKDLASILTRDEKVGRGGPTPARLAQLVRVCDAIAFAHARGVIHRDIKPANVMVGEFGEVLVVDWGLAKELGGTTDSVASTGTEPTTSDAAPVALGQTVDGAVMGTLGYMPPEQAQGRVRDIDERADVFALGAMLHRVLAGRERFAGNSQYEALARITDPDGYEPPSAARPPWPVPWELEAAVARAMAFAPTDRYATAELLRADIERYLAGRTLEAAQYSAAQRLWKLARRHRIAVTVALAIAALLGGAWHYADVRERDATGRAAAQRAAALAGQVEHARRELALARDTLARVTSTAAAAPDAARRAAGSAQAELAFAERLDALRALLLQDTPTDQARAEAALLARERESRCSDAARSAMERGEDVLAQLWLARAQLADPAPVERALAAIAQARREDSVAQTRALLAQAAVGKNTGADWLDFASELIARRREGAVVELLLARDGERYRYVEGDDETVRVLAIRALGRLGDTATAGPDGKDTVAALLAVLGATDTSKQQRIAIELVVALGRLSDPRAYAGVAAKRRDAGATSPFHQETAVAFERIPIPDSALRLPDGATEVDLAPAVDCARRGQFTRALAMLDAVLARLPGSPLALARRAEALCGLERLDLALADCDLAIAAAPTLAAAHATRAVVLSRMQRYADAISAADRAAELDPAEPQHLVNRAAAMWLAGDRPGAEAVIDRAIARFPTCASALAEKGDQLYQTHHYARAIVVLDKACELDPNSYLAACTRGIVRLELGQVDAASLEADRALAIAPDLSTAYVVRARVRLARGQPREAKADLDRALGIVETIPALDSRSRAHEQLGDRAAALADADRMIVREPGTWVGHDRRGQVLVALGHFPEAIAAHGEAVRCAPGNPIPLSNRGLARHRQGDLAGAIADYDAAITAGPKRWELYFNRADARRESKDYTRALADYDEAIRLEPKRGPSYYFRAHTHYLLGHETAAVADFETCIRLAPDHADAWRNRGVFREKAGDLTGALADYDEAARLAPREPLNHSCRGNALRAAGRLEAAAEAYDAAARLTPDDPAAAIEHCNVLLALRRYDEALRKVDELLVRWPHHKDLLAARPQIVAARDAR